MTDIIVTTDPYGSQDSSPRDFLKNLCRQKNMTISYNETGKKYTSDEISNILLDENPSIIIAGTEKYDARNLVMCPNLRMISRVGAGLDSIDLCECRDRGICVTYTPNASTNSVAELSISLILNLLRDTHLTHSDLISGKWKRVIGRELSSCHVGIIGCGRIGASVLRKLTTFVDSISVCDIDRDREDDMCQVDGVKKLTKEEIFSECDVITLHIPLNKENRNYLCKKSFQLMKSDAILINTARGGLINEDDLFVWLSDHPHARAGIDTFDDEPYSGTLRTLRNVILTPHLGSCTRKSRLEMEMGAARSVDEYLRSGDPVNRIV